MDGLRGLVMFVLEQWAGMLPLTLPLAGVALLRAWRSARPAERFLVWCFVPMVAFFFVVSSFRFIHLMWPMPAFLSLTVLMAGEAAKAEGRVARFYSGGRGWLGGIAAAAFALGALHLAFFLPGLSPAPGMYGWDQVAAKARELRQGMPEGTFYLGLGRNTPAPASWRSTSRPFDVRRKNLVGEMGRSTTTPPGPGHDAVVVLEEGQRSKSSVEQIKSVLTSVEPGGDLIMPVGRHPLLEVKPLRFRFFRCRGYNPRPPPKD
jgi:hypothetical protein